MLESLKFFMRMWMEKLFSANSSKTLIWLGLKIIRRREKFRIMCGLTVGLICFCLRVSNINWSISILFVVWFIDWFSIYFLVHMHNTIRKNFFTYQTRNFVRFDTWVHCLKNIIKLGFLSLSSSLIFSLMFILFLGLTFRLILFTHVQ